MEKVEEIAEQILTDHEPALFEGIDDNQAAEARQAFGRWILAKLEEFDPELFTEEEYIDDVIPGEMRYQFKGLDPEARFVQALTAYDQLRVRVIGQISYERARDFIHDEGEREQQKAGAEVDLEELRQIEARLSRDFPAIYSRVKKQISESKLDCMYVIRDGGAASLRLGREIARGKLDSTQ